MNNQVLRANIIRADRSISSNGEVLCHLTLDCSYLTLIRFTSIARTNQVKRRKRGAKGLSESKAAIRASITMSGKTHEVDAEIAFVTPLDANAEIIVSNVAENVPSTEATIEFVLVDR